MFVFVLRFSCFDMLGRIQQESFQWRGMDASAAKILTKRLDRLLQRSHVLGRQGPELPAEGPGTPGGPEVGETGEENEGDRV